MDEGIMVKTTFTVRSEDGFENKANRWEETGGRSQGQGGGRVWPMSERV